MKKNVLPRAVAAVVLLAVIVLTMVFLVTGNFNIFTQVACPLLGILLFIEMGLVCSLI